jgi:transcriptional regulator with XRE-family HTH domain
VVARLSETPQMPKFHQRLKALRKERGYTRYRLSKLSGLSQEGIAILERPKADPKLSTLLKLAKALDVKVCQLVHHESEEAQ